jgi:hypothetical protein
MPHIPDTAHDTHDLELVAAHAAGDARGADLEQATALVAACTECAALHHDLRAIAAAMPELPAPARPRDFRLTPEQAASLRPTGIRGFLAAFSAPRFAFATPLGTGLAALGIVGVLVASGGFASGGTAGGPPAPGAGQAVTIESASDRQAASAAAASAAPNTPAEAPGAGAAAAETPSTGVDTMGGEPAPSAAASAAPVEPESSKAPAPSSTRDEYLANVGPTPAPSATPATSGTALAIPDPEASILAAAPPPGTPASDAGPVQPTTAAALVLLVAGLALVALRWIARRA